MPDEFVKSKIAVFFGGQKVKFNGCLLPRLAELDARQMD